MPTSSTAREARRVYFLVSNVDAPGGLVRVVVNLANNFAENTRVEIISIFRRSDQPFYRVDDRVQVTYLIDERRGAGEVRYRWLRPIAKRLAAKASVIGPKEALKDQHMSRLSDVATQLCLRMRPPGILISTHPSLHAMAVRYGRRSHITVAQEHMSLEGRNDALMEMLRATLPQMDAVVALTDGDRTQLTDLVRGSRTDVRAIPNAIPWQPSEQPAQLTNRVVLGVGALLPRKGFARLIEAFAPVAAAHPDWQLHIYGQGHRAGALQKLVADLDLSDQVQLKGQTDHIEDVLEAGSVFALSSFHEGFPMALVEAMSKGLPVVSFDCPTGPADMIADGRDGFLVPDGDIPAFSGALERLVADTELRRGMGSAALASSRRYEVGSIVEQWDQLFDSLRGRRSAQS